MAYLPDLDNPDRVAVVDNSGKLFTVSREYLNDTLQQGYRQASPDEVAKERERLIYEDKDIQATALGAARGVTLGLSDVALTKTGLYQPEELRKIEEHNVAESMVGEIGGTAASMFLPGVGAANLAKAGRLAKIAKTAYKSARTATGLPRGVSTTAKWATKRITDKTYQKAAEAAVEGVFYGGGHWISRKAMEDPAVNAEYAGITLGLSALAGAGTPLLLDKVGKHAKPYLSYVFKPNEVNVSKTTEELATNLAKNYKRNSDSFIKPHTKSILSRIREMGYETYTKNEKPITNIEITDLDETSKSILTKIQVKVKKKPIKTSDASATVDTSSDSFADIAEELENIKAPDVDYEYITVFEANRTFGPDGIILSYVEKKPDFKNAVKGLQKQFYSKVDIPTFIKTGYEGKTVKTTATNISTARNFSNLLDAPKFDYDQIRAIQEQHPNLTIREIYQDIAGFQPSEKLKQPDSLIGASGQINVEIEGKVPSKKTIPNIFQNLSNGLVSKLTGIDKSIIKNFLYNDETASLLRNPNVAREAAKSVTKGADLFNSSFETITEIITGKSKGRLWDSLLELEGADLHSYIKKTNLERKAIFQEQQLAYNEKLASIREINERARIDYENKIKSAKDSPSLAKTIRSIRKKHILDERRDAKMSDMVDTIPSLKTARSQIKNAGIGNFSDDDIRDTYTYLRYLDDEGIIDIDAGEDFLPLLKQEIQQGKDSELRKKFLNEIGTSDEISPPKYIEEPSPPSQPDLLDVNDPQAIIKTNAERTQIVLNRSLDTLQSMAKKIDNMIEEGVGSFGYISDLKKIRSRISKRYENIVYSNQGMGSFKGGAKTFADIKIGGLSPIGHVYYQMDELKRDIGKFVSKNINKHGLNSSDQATLHAFGGADGKGGIYQELREFLENEYLFTGAAKTQKNVNKAWYKFLELNNFKGKRFFIPYGKKDGFFDAYKADQDSFESLLKNLADERSPLVQEYFDKWVDGSMALVKSVEKSALHRDAVKVYNGLLKEFKEQAPTLSEQEIFEFIKKTAPTTTEQAQKSLANNIYNNVPLIQAISLFHETSSLFIPFISSAQRKKGIRLAGSGLGFEAGQDMTSTNDFLQASMIQESSKAIPQRQGYATAAGIVGGVAGGGILPGGVSLAAAAAVQEVQKTFVDPIKYIERYRSLSKVADKLSDFASTAVQKTSDVTAKAIQGSQPAYVPAAAITVADIYKQLTNKDLEKDSDFVTTLGEITSNPMNAVDRIADNLSDLAEIDDDVATELASRSMEQLQFLNEKVSQLATKPSMGKQKGFRLSSVNRKKVERYINALNDPLSILNDLKRGRKPSNEAMEVIQRFYPDILAQIQSILSSYPDSKFAMDNMKRMGIVGDTSINKIQSIYSQQGSPEGGQQQQAGNGASFTPPKALDAQRLST